MWPSDAEPSLPVTLIAMQALKYAEELKLEGTTSAYNKGSDWLAQQANTDQVLDGFTLAGYSAVGYIYQAPWERQAEFVEKSPPTRKPAARI